MDNARIAGMAENIVAAERIEVSPDDDESLAMVDQAFDSILAAVQVIDEHLPKVKADGVPQKAARDAIEDIMETALKPYLADALKAMQTFEGPAA